MKLNNELIKRVDHPIKIMQFGEGNFLRCFVDWIINRMNKSGDFSSNVVVVQPLKNGRIDELRKQDGLYTSILEGINNKEVVSIKEIIEVLEDFINPYKEYDKYLEYAKKEDLEYIISNTTEAGIILDKEDVDYEMCPNTFPSKLLVLLKTRFDYFNGDKNKGLHILPCELIDNNGDKLKLILNELACIKEYSNEFKEWLNNCNYFYNTLVDRIVPGFPVDQKEEYESLLSYKDNNMVKGEFFHLWVIEDKYGLEKKFKINKANLNVLFVRDIKPYKERKVKILNGSHTLIFSVAYLCGFRNIYECVNNDYIYKFIMDFLNNEVIDTIDLKKDELHAYVNDVINRFKNPYIKHKLLDISLNSMTKFKTRIYDTILINLNNNIFPKCSLISYAALIAFYIIEKNNIKDNKEFIDFFGEIRTMYNGSFTSCVNIVSKVMKLKHFEIDLSVNEDVLNYVAFYLNEILDKGMKKTLEVFYG